MDNEANISDVIQLPRFSGEALSFGIKAIGGTGKTLKRGKDLGSLAVMQEETCNISHKVSNRKQNIIF
ncbi:MAG: hypothetical protein ACLUR5_03595 [Eubacterium ventriosum]